MCWIYEKNSSRVCLKRMKARSGQNTK